MRRAFFSLLLLSSYAASAQQVVLPEEVRAVIDRSHASRADYSVFLTTEITVNGQTRTEVNAEFQHGAMHRIEVGVARVLVDCDAGNEVTYDVSKSTFVDRRLGATCGIAMDADKVISGRLLSPITSTYGRADVIELTGEKFVRTYAVTSDGIIVANSYEPRSADVGFSLRTLDAHVTRGTPDETMFKPSSLERAYAPKVVAANSRRKPYSTS